LGVTQSADEVKWPDPPAQPGDLDPMCVYDNALAETINGLYKTELVHRHGPWRNMQDLELATLGWVDWFNNRHLLGPIGNIPPAEAEENFYAQRDVLDMVA